MYRVVNAIETGNTQLLCRLSDPDELARLNISAGTVGGFLSATLWNTGFPKHGRVEPIEPVPVDQAVWHVSWINKPQNNQGEFYVPLIDDPRKGWRLNISNMLIGCCAWRCKWKPLTKAMYVEMARKYGLRGVRHQDGDYIEITQLEEALHGVKESPYSLPNYQESNAVVVK